MKMNKASDEKCKPGQILQRRKDVQDAILIHKCAPTTKTELVLEWVTNSWIDRAVPQKPFGHEPVRIRVHRRVPGHRPITNISHLARQFEMKCSPGVRQKDRSSGYTPPVVLVLADSPMGNTKRQNTMPPETFLHDSRNIW